MARPDMLRLALQAVGLAAGAIATAAFSAAMMRSDAPGGGGGGGGVDVAIVIDVSMSMRAGDVAPDRLTEARRQLIDLLRAAPPDRAAVIAFAGDARVICPLTSDLDAVREAIATATPTAAAAGGSDIATALERAGEVLGQSGESGESGATANGHGRILLVSDGERGPGDERPPAPIAQALAARGVALTVIGVGTARGAPIPLREGRPGQTVSDENHQPRLSRLDRDRLASLAEAAGEHERGRYIQLEAGKTLPAPGLTRDAAGDGSISAMDVWKGTGLLVVIALTALLLDTALWWLRRSTNPWG
jgi:Ca-activated chloride channel homolog